MVDLEPVPPGQTVPVYDSHRRPHPFVEELIELYRYRDLVALWSVRNITLRYKRSVLGIGWSLLEPMMMMLMMTLVFSRAFRSSVLSYPLYVLSGLLLFNFFSRTTKQIVEEIVASRNLAQRIHLPRSAFALATIIAYLTNWALALAPLAAIMLFLKQPFTWHLLTVPLTMLLTALFAAGVGLIVATLSAFFHDFKLSYEVLLTAWFYATPVIYPIEIVPEYFRPILQLNPLYYSLQLFRAAVVHSTSAPLSTWAVSGVTSLAAAAVGWWIFTRSRQAIEYRV